MKRLMILAPALALATSVAFAQPYGYGPGMMGGSGYGYGPGMMGGYGFASLKLTPEQSEKIAGLHEEHRKKTWGAMGEMRSEMFKLRRLYAAETLDSKAIAEQQKKVDGLRSELLASRLETQKQIEAVLTPEQRKQFQAFRPGWMHGPQELE